MEGRPSSRDAVSPSQHPTLPTTSSFKAARGSYAMAVNPRDNFPSWMDSDTLHDPGGTAEQGKAQSQPLHSSQTCGFEVFLPRTSPAVCKEVPFSLQTWLESSVHPLFPMLGQNTGTETTASLHDLNLAEYSSPASECPVRLSEDFNKESVSTETPVPSLVDLSTPAYSEPSTHFSPINSGSYSRYSSGNTSIGSLNHHRCHVCNAGFDTKSDLTHHLRVHIPVDQRQYACGQCGKRFLFPKDLRRHSYVHTSNQLFCDRADCKHSTKGFTRRDHLERHLLSVHGTSRENLARTGVATLDRIPEIISHSAEQGRTDQKAFTIEAASETSENPSANLHADSKRPEVQVPGENGRSGYIQTPERSDSGSDSTGDVVRRPTSHVKGQSDDSRASTSSSGEPPDTCEDSGSSEDEGCRCDPQACHADACSPTERTKGRKPDIRRLLAFLTLDGTKQSAENTTCGTDGENDTTRRVARAAMSLSKKPRLNKRNDDGDQKTPDQANSEGKSPVETETRFKCPIAAD